NQCKITKNLSQNVVHSDSDLILHNSSVLIDKEPKNLDFWYYFFGGQYNDSLFLLDIKIPFFEKLVLIFFELFQAILHYFSRFNFFVFTE
ncbi:hypothetical protein QQ510_14760, partial [Enterococcus faecium]|nr:hypothetical protein [Enterococcus faecium]